MKNKLLLWVVLLLIGFLAGFIPQYSKARQASSELSACQTAQQVSQIRDIASMMYLTATQKNYGISAGYAAQFFDQAQKVSSSTQEEGLRNQLRDVLSARDQITADLAKGNEAVIPEMQPVLMKLNGK